MDAFHSDNKAMLDIEVNKATMHTKEQIQCAQFCGYNVS